MLNEILVRLSKDLAAGVVIDQGREEITILMNISYVKGTPTRQMLDYHLARVRTALDFKGMLQVWQLAIVT